MKKLFIWLLDLRNKTAIYQLQQERIQILDERDNLIKEVARLQEALLQRNKLRGKRE